MSSDHKRGLLALPQYVHDHSKVLIETPIRILVIIVTALVIRAILIRMINRTVRPIRVGEVPGILRPFKERVENSTFFESTGLVSERREQRAATIGSVLRSAVSFTILVITFLLILSELGINLAPFIAGTSIIGVALGFGAQNLVKDFLAGMFMTFEDQYGVGDVIDFEQASGTVEAVGLRTTTLRDVNGTVWYVRNGEVIRVGNMSQGYAQVVLDVPIAGDADVAAASAAMLAVAQELRNEESWADAFMGEPELLGVEQFNRFETVIRLVVKVRPMEQWRVARELRLRTRARLERLDIDSQLPPEPDAPQPPTA